LGVARVAQQTGQVGALFRIQQQTVAPGRRRNAEVATSDDQRHVCITGNLPACMA
jgi:hypothetical protein